MNFLVDAQLPPALAVQLRATGHDSVHVTDVLPGNAPDVALLDHAARHGLVIISKDADFVQLAGQTRPPVQLLWVRLGNCGNRRLVERLLTALPDVVRALASGAGIVELR
jgi:predicted nuclease of predicted toxin-antitoxin system